jgi:hypothetical protein
VRAWVGHAVFATILIGSFAAKERAAEVPIDGPSLLEPAILRIAGSHGLDLREYRTTSGMMSRALVFDSLGCSRPVLVSLRLWTFEEESLMNYASEQGYTRRYIYFDRSWDRPDTRAMFGQRVKYWALAVFGLTEYFPSQYLILAETPKNCRNTEAIDWRSVWNRDNLAAANAKITLAQ